MTTDTRPEGPFVDVSALYELVPGVWIIPDGRVGLVPNIGIIEGRDRVLVVDCGMGVWNGDAVLAAAERIAAGRPITLTLTHFHPEHGFGAQSFAGRAEIFYNQAQAEELAAKGAGFVEMFRGFGPGVAAALDGVQITPTDRTWQGARHEFDLGGRRVVLEWHGTSHTKGDQTVALPDDGILFTGDLAEERIFPIFPYFPPDETDIDAANWVAILRRLEAAAPRIVVPGHGSVGGPEILTAVRSYLELIAARVTAGLAAGQDAEVLTAELTAELTAAHPDWEAPEWIGFAVRYHADRI